MKTFVGIVMLALLVWGVNFIAGYAVGLGIEFFLPKKL